VRGYVRMVLEDWCAPNINLLT